MSLKNCIQSLQALLKDFDVEAVVEAAEEYQARGMDRQAAETQAVQDHLDELQRDRARIEKAIADAYAVESAAHEAATSPKNALPAPTDAQKEAGNYQKGHVRIAGLDISIENPAGSRRRPEWPALKSHYGYIKRTEGKDGDHVDVFIKPGTPESYDGPVFVVDQKKPGNGHFDEHKVLLGWDSLDAAREGYLENYTPGWDGIRDITQASQEDFALWLHSGYTKTPFAEFLGIIERDRARQEQRKGDEPTKDAKLRPAIESLPRTPEQTAAIIKYGLPEGAVFETGNRALTAGKVRVLDSNWHDTIEAAAREAAEFLRASVEGRQNEQRRAEAERTLAAKLNAGEAPSTPEWAAAFPGVYVDGHTYFRQPDIAPFLVKYFGFSPSRIRGPLGAAAGVLRSDVGAEYPIVRISRLPEVLKGKAVEPSTPSFPPPKIVDVGEKVGGARKDTATPTGPRSAKAEEDGAEPGWRKRFQVTQIVKSAREGEAGRWVIHDLRTKDFSGKPRQFGRDTYPTREAAEAMVPLAAVALKHGVRGTSRADGTVAYEIWRRTSDRKSVKVVDEVFATHDDAVRYMAEHAAEIVETKTSFGEEILPRPETVTRTGPARRTGNVAGDDFRETFGFRAVEFGEWNAQDERQTVMNHAYDALMDLAEIMGVPPKALGLNGELALAFGARGHGLTGARAHYERDYGIINLTKMSGAGSLGHEWFHALDHYFARQDGKSGRERVRNERGDFVYPAESGERDFASHGFQRSGSEVRPEVRAAYTALIETMFAKAEQYVEDTQKAERFVGETRNDLAKKLEAMRTDLAEQKDPRYWKRKNQPASAEQLAHFDTLAEKLISGEALDVEMRRDEKARSKFGGFRQSNDVLDQISAIYKAVRGRSGFDTTNRSGMMDAIANAMRRYKTRLEVLASAKQGESKTKRVPTSFQMEAKSIDQGRASEYWATPHEMAARAFSAYLEDRMADRGFQGDFLTYGTNFVVPTPWGWRRPFPEGAERKAINEAFDKFVGTLGTRETERGVEIREPPSDYETTGEKSDEADYTVSGKRTSYGIDPRQLDLFAPAQRDAHLAARKAVVSLGRGAPTVLGSRIAADFREQGRVDLIGQEVHSPADLAVLAQVYRDPRFETLRYIFTNDAGRVVYQTGVTSRLPGAAYVMPMSAREARNAAAVQDRLVQILKDGKAAGGTQLWLLHNHPSGISEPSSADRFLTARMGMEAAALDIKTQPHVIINHNEYSTIDPESLVVETGRISQPSSYDLDVPRIPHRLLGRKISGPADVVALGKEMEADPDTVVIIGRGGRDSVVGLVATANAGDLDSARAAITLRRLAIANGVSELFAVNVPARLEKAVKRAMEIGLIVDAVDQDGASYLARGQGAASRGDFALGRRPFSVRVESGIAPYDPTGRDAFRLDVIDTVGGPMFINDEITLFPGGDHPLTGQWGDDGAGFTIVDTETGANLGVVILGMSGKRVTDLYWIASAQAGAGRKTVRALAATADQPIQIRSIIPSAIGFWDKMGASRRDEKNDAPLTWGAFEEAARHARVGTGAAGEPQADVAGDAGPSGRVEEAQAGYTADTGDVGGNRALREQDRTFRQKAKQWFRRQFAPGGLLPDAVFREKIARDNELQVVEFDIRHLVGRLERVVHSAYGVEFDALNDGQREALQRGLAGDLDGVPESVRHALAGMRHYIDRLSVDYVQILRAQTEELLASGQDAAAVAKAELMQTIMGNIGEYVHRSYRAFDDPKWFQKIPDDTLNAARAYLRNRYLQAGEPADRAARMAEATLNEIVKNGTAYDSMEAFIKESKLGAKDLSVLKQRKRIAPEIRALLGEYTDPRVNFAKSATKMGRLIWNQHFLDAVREIGLGVFLFEGADRPAGATSPIAAEASEVYAPLNGLWTFPEINQAFKDALGRENLGDIYRVVVRLNGLVKYGKTVLSPTTAARNWQSAMFFALANGHFNLTETRRSLGALREYFTQQGEGETLAYLRKLKQLGVVYDTPYAGEMMRLMRDARLEELLASNSGKALRAFEKGNQYARDFYSFGDDFWKIVGFENEKRALILAGLAPAAAEREAAERIRNTYPTYSMVGRGVQSLARNPFIGTFVSFPAEIIRTTGNMLRYIARDLRSSNPRMRVLGLKRAVGMALVAGGFHAVSALSRTWLGMDDDDEEAVRELAAPWQKNSSFLFVGRDEDGHLRYFDLSFLDPYGYWKRPVTAMLRDQPWEDAAASVLKEILVPFLGTDIAAGAIIEIIANKKSTGGPVYNDEGPVQDQVAAIADHLRRAVQPGIVSNIERATKAMAGERQASGRVYSKEDEALALVGWRASTLDPRTSLYYRTFEFEDQKQGAMKSLTDVLRDVNPISDDDIVSAHAAALNEFEDAYAAMRKAVQAARLSGMTDTQMAEVMKLSGIGREDIAIVLGRRPPVMRISERSVINAVKKVRSLFGEQAAKTVLQRYRRAASLTPRKAG